MAQHPSTDILVGDDGLQHGALARDIEVCVFNAQGVGNGLLLPAGPLREPWPRAVDLVVYAGAVAPYCGSDVPSFALQRQLADYALRLDGTRIPLVDLHGVPCCAVAAIARPEDFFSMLRAQGLHLAETHALPDHYDFDSYQRTPHKGYSLICTEKDAAKLWRHHPDALAVPLEVRVDNGFFTAIDALLKRPRPSPSPSPSPRPSLPSCSP